MSEMIVKRESLQRVADKIKSKAGTTGELVFPEGFEGAVDSISGGDTTAEDGLVDGTLTEYSNPRVTTIRGRAFYYYTNLTSVDFPSAISIGAGAFDGCTTLTSVDFPQAKDIGQYAFSGCSNLTSVDFPQVTEIGQCAFRSCSNLTSVDFPLVTDIGNEAFSGCSSLTALILRSDILCTLKNTSAFTKCYHFLGTVNATYNPEGLKDGYFYVPSALIDDYKAATNWSTFATQFRALEDYTVDGTTTGELDETKIGA